MSDLFVGVPKDYQIIGHLTACGQYPNYKARAQDNRKSESAGTKHVNAGERSVEIPTRGATGTHQQIYISTLFWASYVPNRNQKLRTDK